MTIKESIVEKFFCKRANDDGHFVAKFVDPTRRGAPDRILFTAWGSVYLVELKRPRGGKLSALQVKYHEALRSRNVNVHVVNTVEAVNSFFRMLAL